MRLRAASLAAACSAAVGALHAQEALTINPAVGLQVLPAGSTTPFGAACTWFTCTPYQVGPLQRGATHIVQVYGEPMCPYVLAIDAPPTNCRVFPFTAANALALNHPLIVGSGVLSGPLPGAPCLVGTSTWFLSIPTTVPAGLDVLMQGCIGRGQGWLASFTPTVLARTL